MLRIADGSLAYKRVVGDEVVELGPTNKERMEAIAWLADRAYGKAVDVLATVDATDEQREEVKQLAKAIYESRTATHSRTN